MRTVVAGYEQMTYSPIAEGRHEVFKCLFVLFDECVELFVVILESQVVRRHLHVHSLQFRIIFFYSSKISLNDMIAY